MSNESEEAGISAGERRAVVRATALACLLFTATITLADPDLWGHTYYGLRCLQLGVLVETADPFSYTAPGSRWINHEWLTEAALGRLWSRFGNPGLVAWRVLWIAILFWVLAAGMEQRRASAPAGVMLLVFTTETLADFLIFVRPQLATFALFAWTLHVWRLNWDGPHRALWLTIPAMALWTNLHGGFLSGIAIAGLYSVWAGFLAVGDPAVRPRALRYAVAGAGMVAATFLNPYGWELHRMLWQHLETAQFVREWQPLWDVSQSPVYYVPFGLGAFALLRSRSWRSIDLLVLGFVGWQAAAHLRHVALLAIAVAVLMPVALSDALSRTFTLIERHWSTPAGRKFRRSALVALFSLLLGLRLYGSGSLWREGIGPWDVAFETSRQVPGMPLEAVSWIKEQGLQGNILTDYGWGQFVIWHLFPNSRVAFDGRYRTVYPAGLEAEFMAFQTAHDTSPERTPMLDKFPTDWALLPIGSGGDRYLRTRSDWILIRDDGQSVVYGRHGNPVSVEVVPAASNGKRSSLPRWTRFPGDLSARRLRD